MRKINGMCEEQNLLYGVNLRYLIHFPLPVNTYSHYHLLLQMAKISKKFGGTQYETDIC